MNRQTSVLLPSSVPPGCVTLPIKKRLTHPAPRETCRSAVRDLQESGARLAGERCETRRAVCLSYKSHHVLEGARRAREGFEGARRARECSARGRFGVLSASPRPSNAKWSLASHALPPPVRSQAPYRGATSDVLATLRWLLRWLAGGVRPFRLRTPRPDGSNCARWARFGKAFPSTPSQPLH